MDDERLIELVRENSVLYDLSHAKYKDAKLKNNLWNRIGQQLKLGGTTCKARWNNIRDNYRKSLKKTTSKSGRKRSHVKFYKFHEQLNFLDKYFKERPNIQRLGTLEDPEFNATEDVESDVHTHSPSPSRIQSPMPSIRYVATPSLSPSTSHRSTPTVPPQYVPTSKKRKGEKKIVPKTAAATLMEYVIERKEANVEHIQHPVDAFLSGIAPTLKNLSQIYLNIAKSEIFATVQKYEMKMITEELDIASRN